MRTAVFGLHTLALGAVIGIGVVDFLSVEGFNREYWLIFIFLLATLQSSIDVLQNQDRNELNQHVPAS